jgi:transposase
LPDAAEVGIEYLKATDPSRILMVLRTIRNAAHCPRCGTLSERIHSRHLRKLDDLPWEGVPVRVQLRTRRFFCVRPECAQTIFSERLPATVTRYGRRTRRLSEVFTVIAMAMGGQPGARLAQELGIRTSGDSLLRHLRSRTSSKVVPSPRILGIDDWA